MYKPSLPSILFPIFAIVWILIFLLLSVYDGRKNLYAVDEFAGLSLGSLLAAVSLAGLLYFTYRDVSRLLFVVFILIAFAFIFIWRIIVRLSFNLRRTNSIQNRRVLIIGAGPVGRNLEDRIAQYPYLGLHIVGFLDDDVSKRQSEIDIVGNIDESREVIRHNKIDDVVIALPQRAHEKVNWLIVERQEDNIV